MKTGHGVAHIALVHAAGSGVGGHEALAARDQRHAALEAVPLFKKILAVIFCHPVFHQAGFTDAGVLEIAVLGVDVVVVAAQIDEIFRVHAGTGQQVAPETQDFVDCFDGAAVFAAAGVVAEIDDAVAELNISGDSKLLIAVSNVLERIDIDWEAPLAKRLGDVPAHGIGQAIRRSHKLVKQKLQRAGGVFSEFVREEARLSPSKDEAEAFYQSLRQTEMQIDRLEAKLRQRSH